MVLYTTPTIALITIGLSPSGASPARKKHVLMGIGALGTEGQGTNFFLDIALTHCYTKTMGGYIMDSHKTNELYAKFPHLYRERTAPLESSKMGWGFQCEDGWYKIIYEMSKKIQKISTQGEFATAIREVSKNEDGTLLVEARNLSPPTADIIAAAREASRLTCEFCSYSPAFLRGVANNLEGHIACGRCVAKARPRTKGKSRKSASKTRRAPDTIIVKR